MEVKGGNLLLKSNKNSVAPDFENIYGGKNHETKPLDAKSRKGISLVSLIVNVS
jgi:hypothetical protein